MERISDKLVRALPCPAKGNKVYYDPEVKGFGVRVTTAGAKSFVLNYRAAGLERRMTIGGYPAWSAAAAREEARELRRRIDRGEDPLAKRIADREAPTVRDLFAEYETKHLPTKRPRSAADDKSMWTTYILPKLGSMKVAAVTHEDIDALHAEISTTKPVRANRVIEVLRKGMNLAIRWKWRMDNPCDGTKWNAEHERHRYLASAEVASLFTALASHKEVASCDAIRLLVFTGARKSEVLRANWSMFDLVAGTWTKPAATTKQNRMHHVPLSDDAIALLRTIKDENRHDTFVFPAAARRDKDGEPLPVTKPIGDIKRTWASVCATAGVANARIHDLRHTFASMTISEKQPLSIVGALLGHTQASTTMRYAHLYDDPLREATNAAAKRISKAAQG